MPLIILLLPVFIFLKDQNNKNLVEEIVLDFYRKIIERPEFMLSALSIQGSSDSLNAEIREILGLNFPISSFDLDLADLRNRVLSLPPVETAEVRLEGGSILHVKVKEKVPINYGCTHLTEMLQQIGTTAFQGVFGLNLDSSIKSDLRKPFSNNFVDSCYGLRKDGYLLKKHNKKLNDNVKD